MVSSKYFLTPTQWLKNWEDTSWLIDIAQEPIHTYIYSHIYILVGGFKHEWIIFHFIYGMSSQPH